MTAGAAETAVIKTSCKSSGSSVLPPCGATLVRLTLLTRSATTAKHIRKNHISGDRNRHIRAAAHIAAASGGNTKRHTLREQAAQDAAAERSAAGTTRNIADLKARAAYGDLSS
jgi:hypothetical protein